MTNNDATEAFGGDVWGYIEGTKAAALEKIAANPTAIIKLPAPDPIIKTAVLQRFRSDKLQNPDTGAIHIIKWSDADEGYVVKPSALAA